MADEESNTSPKDFKKIFTMAFVVLNLTVLLGGAGLVYMSTLGQKESKVTEKELQAKMEEFRKSLQGDPILYSMDTFTTNLKGVPQRMVRIKVNLEMLDAQGFEEVMGLGAEARDSIIRILNQKTFYELETVQGKLKLKNQIITEVNGFLERGVVKNVYFSNFAVQ